MKGFYIYGPCIGLFLGQLNSRFKYHIFSTNIADNIGGICDFQPPRIHEYLNINKDLQEFSDTQI